MWFELMCITILSKFCQIFVYVLIEMLLKYNANKGIFTKFLKSRVVFAREKLSSLTLLCVVDGLGVK